MLANAAARRVPRPAAAAAAKPRRGKDQVLQRAGDAALRFTLPEFKSPERARSLKCCLIGPTNAGKSTLLNALINQHVAAVSEKIHMTRVNTLGYLTDLELATQVEFLDAPGSLGPDVPALHREIWDAVSQSELALVVVDARDERSHAQVQRFLKRLDRELDSEMAADGGGTLRGPSRGSDGAAEQRETNSLDVPAVAMAEEDSEGGTDRSGAAAAAAAEAHAKADEVTAAATDDMTTTRKRRRLQTALVLNKVDLVRPKGLLLKASRKLHEAFPFDWPPFMISAKTGDGVFDLRNFLLNFAPPGEWMVPAGTTNVQPPLVRATEIIREQIFSCFSQELPYLIEQRNIGWTELEYPQGALRIDQQLLIPKKNSSALKLVQRRLPRLANMSRDNLRREFGRIVFLNLSVGSAGMTENAMAMHGDARTIGTV